MNKKPKIIISETDADRLDQLLAALPANAFPGKAALEAELDRANIVSPNRMPPDVVTMNSTVRFRVSSSNEEFTLKLVYPKDSDQSGTTLSILAPVGSALLGLSQGDEIEWPLPGRGLVKVHLEEVICQPEMATKTRR